ncbi:hypothetical protein B23_3531 [Geobacillus thermoleovorans B23]|nr:hypothetical protein B23_3531 [Geobacillus thermoleovorans B23]
MRFVSFSFQGTSYSFFVRGIRLLESDSYNISPFFVFVNTFFAFFRRTETALLI